MTHLQAIALLVLAAGPAQVGRGQSEDWTAVSGAPLGTEVDVLLDGDKSRAGILAAVSPEGLTLTRKRGAIEIAKSDIRRLWVVGKGSRLKRAGIAALVGFAIGCPIGAGSARYLQDRNNPPLGVRAGWCLALGGFASGVGAGITAAFPAKKHTLVYRRPDGRS